MGDQYRSSACVINVAITSHITFLSQSLISHQKPALLILSHRSCYNTFIDQVLWPFSPLCSCLRPTTCIHFLPIPLLSLHCFLCYSVQSWRITETWRLHGVCMCIYVCVGGQDTLMTHCKFPLGFSWFIKTNVSASLLYCHNCTFKDVINIYSIRLTYSELLF